MAINKVMEIVSFDECTKLHPEQWVKVYGLVSSGYEYINTCQVYQLETVIGRKQRSWFEDIILEPVDESEQPISIKEAMKNYHYV